MTLAKQKDPATETQSPQSFFRALLRALCDSVAKESEEIFR